MAITDRLMPLADRARDQLADMSERDRKLLLGLVVGLLVAVLGGGVLFMKGRLDALEGKVASRKETLRNLELLAADYAAGKTQAEQIASRISEHEGTDLSAYLEQVAQKSSVGDRLDAVRQKSSTDAGDLVETVYAVKLSRLLQDDLTSFLYEMESTGYPLKVRTLSVKARKRGDEVQLGVDMDIAAYRIKPQEGGE